MKYTKNKKLTLAEFEEQYFVLEFLKEQDRIDKNIVCVFDGPETPTVHCSKYLLEPHNGVYEVHFL
jgi:hypothetical protein